MSAFTGKNGFVNVVACLQALKDTVSLEEWEVEIRDVHWVLQQIASLKLAGGYVFAMFPSNAI